MKSNSLIIPSTDYINYNTVNLESNNLHLEYNDTSRRVVSTISHEFRTPLAVINSNLQFLKTFRESLSEEYLNDAFKLCEEAVSNMSRILEDIDLINNSKKGSDRVIFSTLSLNHFLNKILKEFSFENDLSRIKFEGLIFNDLIETDKNLLRQITLNVLSNAVKFSQGEVFFKVTQNIQKNELTIIIEDSGIGILTNEIESIFDPFFRGTNTKQISGTGLGLSVVYENVKALKGGIKIDSILNKGTKFTITIPYEKQVSDIIN